MKSCKLASAFLGMLFSLLFFSSSAKPAAASVPTTTTLTSSSRVCVPVPIKLPNFTAHCSDSGESVTFTATVTPAPAAGETITFFLGLPGAPSFSVLGTGTLNSSGVATFTTSSLPASTGGSLRLYAAYSGDGTFSASSSFPPPLYQAVFLPLIVSCQATNTGTLGVPFDSGPMDVTGGATPYTFSVGSGMLPPGLTLNTSTGEVSGTPEATGTFTIIVTDANGNVSRGCLITIGPPACGSSLTPITYNVHENNTIGEITWFNSHLAKLGGTIPTSNFQIFITGGQITFGPNTLNVPDAVITFSSTANCSSTMFDTTHNLWETTLPLSAASQADEIFAAGLAFLIPSGFPQNVNNVTWSANVSSSAPGLQVTWQYGVSNWLTANKGTSFPVVSSSPFVPDYNSMMVLAAHNATNCYGTNGDHAGAPEFTGRGNVLTGGGSGGGGSNWTGSWSSTPPKIQVCAQ